VVVLDRVNHRADAPAEVEATGLETHRHRLRISQLAGGSGTFAGAAPGPLASVSSPDRRARSVRFGGPPADRGQPIAWVWSRPARVTLPPTRTLTRKPAPRHQPPLVIAAAMRTPTPGGIAQLAEQRT